MPPVDPQVIVASPDDSFRRRVREALTGLRWVAVDAVGGADALNKLDSLAGIEAIVFDTCLPDLDVDDIDLSLRAHWERLDVLFVNFEAEEPCWSNRDTVHARSRELAWHLGRSHNASQARPTVPKAAAPPVWEPLPGVIGADVSMAELAKLVRLVAARKTSVLITGETGTGKEVVAKAIHRLSSRSAAPFVALNCAAIPETLLESELFGYARGAFTGAMQAKAGRIEAANGGTLFLDEIGELPAALQAKLLRFLQEREVQRLGSNETTKVDVRILSATHVNLSAASGERPFRQDLYYRLAVFPVALPPLRERRGDILLLAEHFLSDICQKDESGEKSLSAEARERLLEYSWPGNVRELQHVIERAFILGEDEKVLTPRHFPDLDPEKALNIV